MATPDIITFLLVLLATIRVTRLLVTDKIGEPLRRWILGWSGEKGWATFLIHCPWCTGYWVALPATAALATWTTILESDALPPVIDFLGWWAALAYLTGLTLTRLEK